MTVHRRQTLVIHTPAAMTVKIDRNLNDLRLDGVRAVSGLERACDVEPVEAHDHVRVADDFCTRETQESRWGRGMQRVIGRECGGLLEIGEHLRTELFGERHSRFPRRFAPPYPSSEDHWLLRFGKQMR